MQDKEKRLGITGAAVPLQILGTGEYAPQRKVESNTFDERWEKAAGWTESSTGVKTRAFADASDTTVSMAAHAAKRALAVAGILAEELDAVISVGSIPHQAIPCTAVLVHRELGLGESGVPAFDVNSTCLGFLTALDLVSQGIATGRYRRVLIVASELASLGLDWEDTQTAGLFGDGAGAVVIGSPLCNGPKLHCVRLRTYSNGADLCRVRGWGTALHPRGDPAAILRGSFFEMEGRATYRLAARFLPGFLTELFSCSGLKPEDIDLWIPHQASGRAICHLQQSLGLPMERFVLTLPTKGNQIAASLMIALHHAVDTGKMQRGQQVALIGSGAGLSLGGALLEF